MPRAKANDREAILKRDFNANTFGAINLSRSFLPHFRSKGTAATIVFISSAAGITGSLAAGSYTGSKHALEGMVDSLHTETSAMGIRSLVFEPGMARTQMITNAEMPTSSIAAYKPLMDFVGPWLANQNGKQAGDPRKMAEIVVAVVKGEGVAVGKVVDPYGDLPLRLPIGPDAYDAAKKRAEGYLKVLESWEHVIKGTNFDE